MYIRSISHTLFPYIHCSKSLKIVREHEFPHGYTHFKFSYTHITKKWREQDKQSGKQNNNRQIILDPITVFFPLLSHTWFCFHKSRLAFITPLDITCLAICQRLLTVWDFTSLWVIFTKNSGLLKAGPRSVMKCLTAFTKEFIYIYIVFL